MSDPMMDQPDVRYCMTDDGVRLAYYVMGEGSALVRASGFPSHLTGIWAMSGFEEGSWRLAREHRVVTYDPRGMGLSQRVLDFSLDTRVADLRAIVRHLGALSLVLPDFARDATNANFMDLAATFRLDATNRWVQVEQHELAKHLEVVP